MNFGIIGFGKMGKIRYDSIRESGQHSVLKIYEPDHNYIPSGVKQVNAYQEILADPEIEAVFICVPNYLNAKYVIECLNYGKHVFCEKPPGIHAQEVMQIREAEDKNPGLKVMFGFNHRHHESMIHAKKLIDSEEYGKILWLRGRYGKSVDEKFFSNWRSNKALAGGGILLDQGIHMLDLFLMFCGDFQEVQAYVSNLYWKLNIEDNVFAILRNEQGQVASLHSTMTQWRHLFSLEIFLERGYITINGLKTSSDSYGDEAMTIARNRTEPPAAVWTQEEEIIFHTDHSWRRELEAFVDAIEKGFDVPTGNTRDALKLMKLIDQIYHKDKRQKKLETLLDDTWLKS